MNIRSGSIATVVYGRVSPCDGIAVECAKSWVKYPCGCFRKGRRWAAVAVVSCAMGYRYWYCVVAVDGDVGWARTQWGTAAVPVNHRCLRVVDDNTLHTRRSQASILCRPCTGDAIASTAISDVTVSDGRWRIWRNAIKPSLCQVAAAVVDCGSKTGDCRSRVGWTGVEGISWRTGDGRWQVVNYQNRSYTGIGVASQISYGQCYKHDSEVGTIDRTRRNGQRHCTAIVRTSGINVGRVNGSIARATEGNGERSFANCSRRSVVRVALCHGCLKGKATQ